MTMDDPAEVPRGLSPPKRDVLDLLKRRSTLSLTDLASELGISKVAALRHLAALETAGLVSRSSRNNGVGRPRAYFELTPRSARLFPEAYAEMSRSAMQFIEDRLGRKAVVELLQQRAHEVHDRHVNEFTKGTLTERVATLARVRDEGGYMAETGTRRSSVHEMLEHNCPILSLASTFPEACEVERRMFESLLDANVATSHRVVAGAGVCRFLIRPRPNPP
ncbi:MAG: MarR family transcriptional regulator [Thermoplasmata archaeon]